MIDRSQCTCASCLLILFAAGCSPAPEPVELTAAGSTAPLPVAEEAAVPDIPLLPEKKDARSRPSPPVVVEEPEPQPPAALDPVKVEPGPMGVVEPGGPIEVAATKPGLTRIGVDKCKICHKLQHASWLETAHARREPPLDCEGCHGPGSEYKGIKVMKDPELARAKGLVDPSETFCRQCHESDWSEDMLRRAHAHKDERVSG